MADAGYMARAALIAKESGSSSWWGGAGAEWGQLYINDQEVPGSHTVSPSFSTQTESKIESVTETNKGTVKEFDGRTQVSTQVNDVAKPPASSSSKKPIAAYGTKTTTKTFPTTRNPTQVGVTSLLWTADQYEQFIAFFNTLFIGGSGEKVGFDSVTITHPLLNRIGVTSVIIRSCDIAPPENHQDFFVVLWQFETVQKPEVTKVDLSESEAKSVNSSIESALKPPGGNNKASGARQPVPKATGSSASGGRATWTGAVT